MRFPLLTLTLFAAWLVVQTASGQSATDKAAAETLFEKGVELLEAGETAQACKKLEASQKLDSGVGTLLYLGECYERLGRVASAWATFREAQSIAEGRGDADRAQVARQRADALEARLPKLWIKVPDDRAEDLTVTRNGQLVPSESWGLAVPVDPVDQVIEATAPGKRPWKTTVSVPDEKAQVEVEIPPLEDEPMETTPSETAAPAPEEAKRSSSSRGDPAMDRGATPAPEDGKGQRTAAIVVGSTGLAGLVVGAALGAVAKNRNDDSKQLCRPDDETLCTRKGVNLRQDAQTAATVSTVGWVVGGAALATGIVLYWTAPSGEAPADSARLELSTTVGPTGGRLNLGGEF